MRCRQRTMARECNLSRETVNRALRWWEVNTAYLGIENRGPGRSNAYHIQWRNLETDWHEIQEILTPGVTRRHADRGVTTHITGGVITDLTGGVITDVTPRTLKGNRKKEPHPEWDHQPSAAGSTRSSMNERESLESPTEFSLATPRKRCVSMLSATPGGCQRRRWPRMAGSSDPLTGLYKAPRAPRC